MLRLILGSTAEHRRALLLRLGLPFESASPLFSELPPPEEPIDQEAAATFVLANARGKALSLRERFPRALILAADQSCECEGRLLGKPGSEERAIAQLELLAGKTHRLHNGVVLLDTGSGQMGEAVVRADLSMRPLSRAEIESYVARERPFHSAGSYLSEGLGSVLFERMSSEEPGAIVGLPMITVARLLRSFGVDPLAEPR